MSDRLPMNHVTSKGTASDVQDALAQVLEPRDGPTKWFEQHHEVVQRAGMSGGKRVRSQLERFLADSTITPAQSEAGRRFAWSYAVGCSERGRSCLAMTVSRGASDYGADTKHQAFIAYDEARIMLDGNRHALALRFFPTAVMVKFCVEDVPLQEIASETMNASAKTAKRRVCEYLAQLAAHYEDVDRRQGRSTTVYTREAAPRRFEPLDKQDEEAARAKRERSKGNG